MTLAAFLTDQAEHFGSKVALYYQDTKITYQELNLTANRIANSLIARGVEKGENVGIFMPNRPEFIQSFFGIVKSGAVAVTINTGLKSEEIEYILNNCRAKRLITTCRICSELDKVREKLTYLEEVILIGDEIDEDKIPFESLLYGEEDEPMVEITTSDHAGIVYTSGTTGYPKGAVLSNGNYFSNIQKIAAATGMHSRTRMLCILPLFHVMGLTLNVLAPMYAGGSVVLMRGFSAREFLPALSKYKVTTFTAVPTVFAILNELPDRDKYDLSSLRFCISGAAPLDVETVKKFEVLYKAPIVEGYGLTEATCAVCINPVDGSRKIGSIGIPLPGVEMQAVDEENYEVDSLEIGEIIVRGDIVMQGYYNDPEATKAVKLNGGWLRTGDFGFVDDDGYFFITGRKKEMIIRGGENIYPKEVEAVLIADDRIAEAAVLGVPHPIWGEDIVAYIVKAPGAELTGQEVIDIAKSRLADYKCPRKVEFTQALPKSVTGKIRKVLLFREQMKKFDEK